MQFYDCNCNLIGSSIDPGPMPMQPYDMYAMQQGKKPMGPNSFYPNNYYPNQPPFYPKADSKYCAISSSNENV